MIKEKFVNYITKGRNILIILFILEIILSMFITPNLYDDEWFMEQITNEMNEETGEIIEHTIPEFVQDRYYTWSSRVIIEFVLCLVLRISKFLWILLECLMVTLAAYAISKIFSKENTKDNNLMLIFMVLVYPYTVMYETGWASTTINYMWPLATMLMALIPIKKILSNEKIKAFEYPIYIVCLIYAGNQEQSASILLASYLIFTVYYIFRNKKLNLYLLFNLILSIASMTFILTCPGNYVRQEEEMYRFIDYGMLTFLDKFILGFTSTFGRIIAKQNLCYTMVSMLACIYVFANYKEKLYRIISLIPITSIMVLGHLSPIFFHLFKYLEVFYELIITQDVILNVGNCYELYYTFPMIFAFLNFICLGMSILLIFKKYKSNVAFLVFLAGIASRIIIAFSPTVFVSQTRTMIFLDFALIIISYLIWQKLKEDNKDKKMLITSTENIIKFMAVMQYINVLIYIYSDQKLY